VQGSVNGDEICEFLKHLVHDSNRKVFLIWNGHPTHISKNEILKIFNMLYSCLSIRELEDREQDTAIILLIASVLLRGKNSDLRRWMKTGRELLVFRFITA